MHMICCFKINCGNVPWRDSLVMYLIPAIRLLLGNECVATMLRYDAVQSIILDLMKKSHCRMVPQSENSTLLPV